MKKTIEVCLTPLLFSQYNVENKIVVIVDILRATSIITTMLKNGAEKIIPVRTLDEAKIYKEKGFLVVAERNGKKLDFADFDNSPFSFTKEKVDGKTLVYSTTNGTNTINMARDSDELILASFLNISAVSEYLINQEKNVLILCSGWDGNYCLEDALFSGALSELLLDSGNFRSECDSTVSSVELWNIARINLNQYIKKSFQYKRLTDLGLNHIIDYCFTLKTTDVIPKYIDSYIIGL